MKPARILAIETSCDETACAVIENGRALLASTVASQMDVHARYGGVYPEVASRQHVLSIVPVVEQTLAQSSLTLKDMDVIAVTRGPGLAGSLVVGMNMAKGLALGTGLPIVGVNHLEGHVYSAWVYNAGESVSPEPQFPLMALIVSGGHTELNLMTDHLTYQRLGSTLDDFSLCPAAIGLDTGKQNVSVRRQRRIIVRTYVVRDLIDRGIQVWKLYTRQHVPGYSLRHMPALRIQPEKVVRIRIVELVHHAIR